MRYLKRKKSAGCSFKFKRIVYTPFYKCSKIYLFNFHDTITVSVDFFDFI